MTRHLKKIPGLFCIKIIIILFVFTPLVYGATFSSTNFEIQNPTLNSAAEYSESTNFGIQGVIPYISATPAASTNFQLNTGFVYQGGSITLPSLTGTAAVDSAELSWTAVTGVTNPVYEVGISGGTGGPYTYDAGISELSATKSSLSSVTTYFFVIRVKDSGGTIKGISNEVSVVPLTNTGGSGGGGGTSSFVPPPDPPPDPVPIPEPGIEPETDDGLASIIDTIIDFIKPKPRELIVIPIEQLVPRTPQDALSGIWNLIPREPVRELVLRPLPQDIKQLAGAFPKIDKLFSEVGITNFNDLSKLKNVSLNIPGITETLTLPAVHLGGAKPTQPKDIRVAELTPELIQKFPKGVLFARLAGGTIDVEPALSINRQGQSEKLIQVLTGKTLSLSIKPDYAAESVKGYLLFKARTTTQPISFIDRLIKTAHAQQAETALVLQEFDFTDDNNDGIYTAQIETPLVSGSYEIITVIDYVDENLNTRALRLLAVVDPEGYVYEKDGDREIRIPGAIATLEWLNPETTKYEMWPAEEYSQQNPQVTEVTGQYSFLVPPGFYQLKVEAPGYASYVGKPFQVSLNVNVHQNIELKSRLWFLDLFDWKTILIIVIGLMLLYNFYRDKIRSKEDDPS